MRYLARLIISDGSWLLLSRKKTPSCFYQPLIDVYLVFIIRMSVSFIMFVPTSMNDRYEYVNESYESMVLFCVNA